MPLFKIATTTDYNGNPCAIYIMQGTAIRDAEMREVNGKPLAKVSVAGAKGTDGDTVYVTLQGWRDNAKHVGRIQKFDSVFAIGALKSRTYNERKYWEMDADFVAVSGVGLNVRTGGGVSVDADDFEDGGFEQIEEGDGELPF